MTARAAPDALRKSAMSFISASARCIFVGAFLTFGPSRFLTQERSNTADMGLTLSSSARTGASISFERTPAFNAASYALSVKMSQPPKTRLPRPASGTSSLIGMKRGWLRLPRRSFWSCVTEPMGCARPLWIRWTPAISVVETAPSPGSRTASGPSAGAIFFASSG